MVKTTPQNVKEANEALFRATMNLPNAAAHCGMTHKEMKMTFREYLKYHDQDYEIVEDPSQVSRRQVQSSL
jgi:glutathione peroxidase-family protein